MKVPKTYGIFFLSYRFSLDSRKMEYQISASFRDRFWKSVNYFSHENRN